MVRCVISDVDGSLIYKGSHLNTARLPVMLKKLEALNIRFAVATGRNYCELKKLFGQYEKDIVCICSDGAYTVKNGCTLTSSPITEKCFDRFSILTKASVVFHSVSKSFFYGSDTMAYRKEQARLGNVIRITSIKDIASDIFRISVYGDIRGFEPSEDIRVCYSSHGIKEYVSPKASKLSAAKTLCEGAGIPLSEVLFFGDGENDRDLILNCGTSYTTYCADSSVFGLTRNHTRDVIGTTIRLADSWQKNK